MTDETMEKVTINGQEYLVPAGMAEALQAQQAQFEDQLEQANSQAAQMQNDLMSRVDEQINAKPQETDDSFGNDINEKVWIDPVGVIREEASKAAAQVRDEIRAEDRQRRSEEDFWKLFWSKNKDLKEGELVVRAVLQRDHSELLKMTVKDAVDTLADRSRKEMLKLSPKSANNDTEIVVEGVSSPINANPLQEAPKSEDGSLSEIMKNRKKARKAS